MQQIAPLAELHDNVRRTRACDANKLREWGQKDRTRWAYDGGAAVNDEGAAVNDEGAAVNDGDARRLAPTLSP